MRHFLRSTTGETLLEVLIALIVIVVGAFGSVKLLAYASVNVQITKERIIATNLAREGIEAMRVVRDTNWLRYAGERRNCWNNFDPSPADLRHGLENCYTDNDDKVQHQQSYIVDMSMSDYRFRLTPVGTHLSLAGGESDTDATYRLRIDPTTKLYTHTVGTPSAYYREVYVEHLDDSGTSLTTAATPTDANVMRVTSRVAWINRGVVRDVTLSTILTDYLGRTDHH